MDIESVLKLIDKISEIISTKENMHDVEDLLAELKEQVIMLAFTDSEFED